MQQVKRTLVGLIGVLIVFHMMGQFSAHILDHKRLFGFVGMFRLQSEHNAPTYFSGTLLAMAGLLLVIIGRRTLELGKLKALPWVALGLMFFYLAADEVTSIHEQFDVLGDAAVFDFLRYKWVILGSMLVVGVVTVFFPFWLKLPRNTRWWFAIAAACYVGGAIGFETISGFYGRRFGEDFGFSMIIVLEEGMEMAGVAIFITALLRYIQPRWTLAGLSLVDTHRPAPALSDKPEAKPDTLPAIHPDVHRA